MKKYPSISFFKLRYCSICAIFLACFLVFSTISATSQGYYKKRSSRSNGSNKKGKVEHKKNILWIEGLGSSQVVSVKYERIMMFGSHFSVRFDLGVTPFVVDEKYNFIAGRSITPITGLGFYYHFNPSPVRIGVGCSVLHDVFFQGIPETMTDSTAANPARTYRPRIMPFAVVEATIKNTWTIRAGYSPIIDPPNENQTELYLTHWAMFGVGYKFGR